MSLLMNEDFSIYQLRLGYLNQIHDGVGERLINLNPAVLNNPAFRTAGWTPDNAAIKRCYSPPIPTAGGPEISNDYFNRPRRPTGRPLDEDDGLDGTGGMVTGHGSEDTIGAAHLNERRRERRRRKEQIDDDDSSDLSDDSDDDESARGPAQSIKFSKMPVRHRDRAKSSPPTAVNTLKAGFAEGPDLTITSPSRPTQETYGRLRSGSGSQIEAVKQRARRDTATSSEMSSDNDNAPTTFKKKLPGRPGKGPSVLAIDDDIQEEEVDGEGAADYDDEDEDDLAVGEASDLSDDEFDGTADSPSMLGLPGASDGLSTSPLKAPPDMLPAISATSGSPKKQARDALPRLPQLPPGPRPVSMLPQPTSMISMMLKGAGGGVGDKPFQRFAELSGKDETSPLWVKIYAPFSNSSSRPLQVPIVRRTKDDRPVTVADLIGLSLWRYVEEDFKPELKHDEANINWWTLRIVDDEEIDDDFPALSRTRPLVDFTTNNNNPPRRARDKPWDEFGLVKATEEQFKENEELTPQIGVSGSMPPPPLPTPKLETSKVLMAPPPMQGTVSDAPPTPTFNPARNPITGPSFAPSAMRKDSSNLLDAPQRDQKQGAAKTGAPRTVNVTFTDPSTFATRNERYETTTDSYIAEIFEKACARLGLDKALFVFKIHGTQVVAPPDRTIEALNEKLHLDLVRRRFAGSGMAGGDGMFGLGLSGSPGSSSPNAPLDLTPAIATPTHTKKKGMKGFTLHPLAAQQKSDFKSTAASTLDLATGGFGGDGKRYNVIRKQPLSFAGTHPRTLIITPEYMTIMPAAPDSLAAPTGKVTNVPMTSVIGAKVSRKHPRMVRILVYKEKEQKRYDFEAINHREAEEIVGDVQKGMDAAAPMAMTGG
ncbi:Target of rapamycin complex 2 subunit sin1 [Fulvia fulva]|uniref:Target of rapamycin complex 2 subunit sin1 n=1 Tax=Passalora fulva TaxID=5499 RepID=A0A9Q8LIF9_PASFU|nr:Target of rapamycin complex 2 subunit sin1 [Fulvia fulva]KAK4624065.1 Target of rapamycin complex 2 subunit sin1 [Fulvia fulva]KAK4625113.1 Target of rapamycin complex 2 subunit sin1 [Fulvia fulva]UJO18079.1 Target of rapamycin complex 2 subunit sin1 [Fulvia fulva]WPV30015.1 Target of rapamycin complex 2 subunit sin1 [Fulvia fulva]